MLIQTSEDGGQVVYLEDVSTQGGIYVELAKLVVIQSQQLCVECTVLENLVLQLTSRLTRSGLGDIFLEGHVVDIRTYSTLQLQVLINIPDGLGCQTEDILFRGVTILIQVPVGVLVVLVVTVPVGIVALAGLIVLQPSLVVSTSQRHEVLTYVALRVAQSMGIVGGEVEVERTCRGVHAKVKVIATHVGLGQDVLVAHIGEAEANASLSGIHRQDSSILCSQTSTEESAGVVLIHGKWTLNTIEILHHLVVGFRTPAAVGARGGCLTELTAVTHTVNLLDIIPHGILDVNGQRTIVFYTNLILLSFLCGDEDDTVRGTATIKGRGSRTFQHGHVFNIIGVDGRDTIAQVITTFSAGTAKVCIVEGHTIDDVERLVVACHLCVTTKHHTCRT